jgi:hypothetical protein
MDIGACQRNWEFCNRTAKNERGVNRQGRLQCHFWQVSLTPISIADLLQKLLPGLVVFVSALGGFIYWLLQRTLDARFAAQSEKIKHELQLELEKMSVVFEHQKDSFRKVLMAMHRAIETIELNVQDEGGDWVPISGKHREAFRRVALEECLFMDSGSEHALELFSKIMWSAVKDASFSQFPDSDDVHLSGILLLALRCGLAVD